MTSMDQVQQKPAKADVGPTHHSINADMSLSRIILFEKRFEENHG